MIDFKNGASFILSPVPTADLLPQVEAMLVDGEEIVAAFKAMRDSVLFTNKRVIAINVQGLTGKKIDFTSLPYSKVQAFSIETAGFLDPACEIDLFFNAIGMVHFNIKGSFDIKSFNRILSSYVL
jgi:Bacterial PH domain